MNKAIIFLLAFIGLSGLSVNSCTFDYGDSGETGKGRPDIVMENIEYVRVRGGDPHVRFRADYAERWEDEQIMEISNFSFEQFGDRGENINAEGNAGTAMVELSSGNVSLGSGIRITIESEDIVIKTNELEWRDNLRILSGAPQDIVEIERSDGTAFTGMGFKADVRNRTWEFSGEVRGIYVETDDEEDEDEEDEEEYEEEHYNEE